MTTLTFDHEPPFRHYLREWRLHRGLTHHELGELVGLSRDEIARYEDVTSGELAMLFRLLVVLKITPAEFFEPPPSARAK
jgi:transcriptional regulator with XRE-family HTH domain